MQMGTRALCGVVTLNSCTDEEGEIVALDWGPKAVLMSILKYQTHSKVNDSTVGCFAEQTGS